jgi:hypothetical protein
MADWSILEKEKLTINKVSIYQFEPLPFFTIQNKPCRLALYCSGTGIRTPIARTKTWSPTFRRSPNICNYSYHISPTKSFRFTP